MSQKALFGTRFLKLSAMACGESAMACGEAAAACGEAAGACVELQRPVGKLPWHAVCAFAYFQLLSSHHPQL